MTYRNTLIVIFYTLNTMRETELRFFNFLSRQHAIKGGVEWKFNSTHSYLFAMWTYVVIFTFRSFIAGERASGALRRTQSHSGRLEEDRNVLLSRESGSRDSSAV